MSTLAAAGQSAGVLAASGGHMTLADGAGAAFILAAVASFFILAIGALISILGSRLGGGMKLVWAVIVIAAPVIGSLAWFVIGRRDAQRRAGAFS